MNSLEWLKFYFEKKKFYTHLDYPIRKFTPKILDSLAPEQISKHPFYPFIRIVLKKNRLRKIILDPPLACERKQIRKRVKKIAPKERPIMMCAHFDSLVYAFYSAKLSKKYEEYLSRNGLQDFPLAYRKINGKCNIEFAKEAFEEIKKQSTESYVLVLDIKDFFGSINHRMLKEKLKKVLNVDTLDGDWYAVFKNITGYSYIDVEELNKIKNLQQKKGRQTSQNMGRWLSPEELRNHKDKIIKNRTGQGIPQGSPISATLSNVYMIDFDQRISKLISEHKGYYRRYSDDMIVIVPASQISNIEAFKDEVMEIARSSFLEISPEKTQLFIFKDDAIYKQEEQTWNKAEVSFLGFSFTGSYVKFKPSTISRIYNKLYREAKILNTLCDRYLTTNESRPPSGKNFKDRIVRIRKKQLRQDQKKKRRNFISYGNKACKTFYSEKNMVSAMRSLRSRMSTKARNYARRRANLNLPKLVSSR